MTTAEETEMIQQGATKLREALTLGRVTIECIREQQRRDVETVRVREYWGDHNDEQRLVTQGIKLRIAARKIILEESELNQCN